MLDVSIVNVTSPEANWNRQTDGQADRQANLCVGRLRLQKYDIENDEMMMHAMKTEKYTNSGISKSLFCGKDCEIRELVNLPS